MQGLEFIVAHDPLQHTAAKMAQKTDNTSAAPKEPSNVWVIRKQIRRKRSGMEEDEVTILATYFVVGDTLFMAPSVSSVIGSRMVCCFGMSVYLVSDDKGIANICLRVAIDGYFSNECPFNCIPASDLLAFLWAYLYAASSQISRCRRSTATAVSTAKQREHSNARCPTVDYITRERAEF